MIQKLRKQFILVAMCSTIAVLVVIISSLNIVNYCRKINEKDEILTILSENGGRFPDMLRQKNPRRAEEKKTPFQGRNPDGNPMEQDEKFIDFLQWNQFSREMPYETRFFLVTLNESGEEENHDLGMIAAIEEEEAIEYAKSILRQYQKGGKAKGFYDEYRYLLTKKDDSFQIIFVDCSADLQETRKGLIASVSVSAVGVLAVFLLVLFFSKKVFRPVEESYQKQRRFITDASHELKTPLTIISANVEVMEMEAEESKWSQSIKKQIDRMVGLVEQMVTLSRMDEQKEVWRESFSMSDAIRDVAEPYFAVAQSEGKAFTAEIAEGITFSGNEKQIRQMTGLLLDNAMKYAGVPESDGAFSKELAARESTGQNAQIRLSLRQKGKKIELKLWNTVETMEPGNQDILFERFYRPDSSRNSEKGGSGIGLSIVKSIVEAHKGKITATSKDGKSIEFKAIF